jgi:tRNA-modifying protein YgfZ
MIVSADPARLTGGTAYADVSSWRAVAISGEDARSWLNDIVSADLADVAPGRSRSSLLLSPVGSVLAAFTVAAPDGELLLVQDPAQPRSIRDLLAPYILSSDVRLDDVTGDRAILAFPGRPDAPNAPPAVASIPSCLGAGVDLIAAADELGRVAASLGDAFGRATTDEVEAWRIAAGIPRIGTDTADADLPQECGLEHAVSYDKGCFLGQEAVAKVRNLGRPRRLVLGLAADGPVVPGDEVVADGTPAGTVTSVARVGDLHVLLARIRWEHRDAALRTVGGTELRPRTVADTLG